MSEKKWNKQKEFSTNTLIDVNYQPEDVADYDIGQAPSSRHTQQAANLEDLVELQKRSAASDELKYTHGVGQPINHIITEPLEPIDDEESPDESTEEPISNEASKDTLEPDTESAEGPEFAPKPISPDDINYDAIMEKFTTAPTKPKYWYEEFGDYWSCSCGHINKGDFCTNCGLTQDILRSIFILRKPGTQLASYKNEVAPSDESVTSGDGGKGNGNGNDDGKNPQKKSNTLSKRAKIIIAIVILLILVATASLMSYYYAIKPAMEKEEAEKVKAESECLDSNIVKFAGSFDDFLWHSYVDAGDACVDKKYYNDSINYYRLAKDIKSTDSLINKIRKSKYEYVKAHVDEGGETFEEYLNDLHKIDYSDINSIYKKYYAWHLKIVANLEEDDYGTDISSASRKDVVYFHVTVSGGPPDEGLDTYYEAKWPGGKTETENFGAGWEDGSKGTARFMYVIPLMGKEGKLTFNVYNKSTQELLGSDTIEFKK